ncbi:Vacuolar protein sorting-associated protein 29, partial [Coemansia sp. BCRC 34301]
GTVDPLLFYCVQAIAARFSEADSTRKPYKRGQRFARAARRLLPTSLKAATLTTLQSITLLSLYMSVSGQWQAGAAYERLAVQLAFVGQYHLLDEEFLLPPVTNNLGLYESGWSEHSHPARLEVLSRPGGILDHEQRRRAWWSVFQLERFNGLAMGRPPIIKPGWHWVWLPCAEDLWARENPSGPLASEMGLATDSLAQRPVASMSSVARVDLVLALIMGQIIEQRTDMFRLFFPRVDKGTLFHDNLATHEMDWPQRLSRLGEAVGALERRIRQWHTELGRKYADHVSARRQANLEIMGASCQIHVLACVLQIREHLFEDLLISEEVKDALGKSVGTPGMVSGTQTPTGELSQSSSGLDLSALFEGHNGSAFDRSVYQRGYMARAKRPPLTQQFVSDFDALAQKCWDRAVAMSDEIARLVRVHWLDTNGGESGGVFGNDEEEESGEVVVERFRLMNPQTPYHLFVAGKVQAARLKQAVTARTGRERMEVDDSDVVKDAIHRINDIWDKHAITADPRAIESRLDDIISALEHSQRIWFSLNFAAADIPGKFRKLLVPGKIDQILCTGNLSDRATLDYLRSITSQVHVARGSYDDRAHPVSVRMTEAGLSIGLVNGHLMVPGGGDVDTLAATARLMDVDVLVSGNTHRFEAYEEQGRFFINPGSITAAFSPHEPMPVPSFVLMEVKLRHVVAYVYQLVNDEVVVDRIEYGKDA